jgi:hypothetical protein
MSDKFPTKTNSGKAANKARALDVKTTLPKSMRRMLKAAENENDLSQLGFNGSNFPDCTPTYVPLKRAKVIKKYDSYITLGADAPNGPGSGYSAFGARCSSIDIVTGRISSVVDVSTNPDLYVLDNFDLDAARIYVSQRTDVDENFGLKQGNVGNSIGRSAVAAKADAIRLIGREGIKLVTSGYGDYNSQGGKLSSTYGIDLIAGNNDSDLQPIPKGDELVSFLEDILELIANLYGIVFSLSESQIEFGNTLATHVHGTTGPGGPTLPSVELTPAAIKQAKALVTDGLLEAMTQNLNGAMSEINYLYTLGSKYINSDFNRTN